MARALVGILTALCLIFTGVAGVAAEVGVITDYSPPGALLYVEHAGAKQPLRIATVVQTGDKIELPANSSVTVELSDSRRMSSSGPGTWEVPAAPALGSIATAFRRMALIMDPDYKLSASAITRGLKPCKREPVVTPALAKGASVKAGERGLTLAWQGGCAPFRLELKSDRDTLQVENGLASREFRFERVSLSPGRYSVSITDSAGTNLTAPFAARSEGPACPDVLAANSSHLGTVARALWLADVDDGAWRMDSVELLVPLRQQNDPLAEAVAARILGQPSR